MGCCRGERLRDSGLNLEVTSWPFADRMVIEQQHTMPKWLINPDSKNAEKRSAPKVAPGMSSSKGKRSSRIQMSVAQV